MISLLARFFCKSDGKSPAQLRTAYGILCGAVGIGLNLLLFLGKFFAGTLSGSVAITADAFNNLSDAGSSVVTLLGFRIAAKAPDPGHPFGHGRAEYLSGLAVSMLILLMGVELAKESLNKILHPALVEFSWLVIGILAASICVKLYMAMYNRSLGKKLSAPALLAAAALSVGVTLFSVYLPAAQQLFHTTAVTGIYLLPIAVGILILVRREAILRLIFVIFGLVILTDALLRIQMSVEAKKFGLKLWWAVLLIAVATGILGMLLLVDPAGGAKLTVIFTGVAFLLEGILKLCVVVYTVKIRENENVVWEDEFREI